MGWGGAGFRPIPAPLPLRVGENPREAKRGGMGQAGWGKIVIRRFQLDTQLK